MIEPIANCVDPFKSLLSLSATPPEIKGAGKYPNSVKLNMAKEFAVARPSLGTELSIIPISGDKITEIRKKRSHMSPYTVPRLVAKGRGSETTTSKMEKSRQKNREPREL